MANPIDEEEKETVKSAPERNAGPARPDAPPPSEPEADDKKKKKK